MTRAMLAMSVLLLLSRSSALAFDEKSQGVRKGARPISEGEDPRVQLREQAKEEYWKMRAARLKALKVAAKSASSGTHRAVPGWKSESDGDEDSAAGTEPEAVSENPIGASEILLITAGAGLFLLLAVMLVKGRRSGGKTLRARRLKDPMARGAMTVKLKPRKTRGLAHR